MFQNSTSTNDIKEILSFTYPKLYTGKEWYVGFYAYDPSKGDMRRKKIKVNHIESITQRRKFASGVIYRLSTKLEQGWNPWIESESSRAFATFNDVCERFKTFITKMYNDGVYREFTFIGYMSHLRNLRLYNEKRRMSITYIYQMDKLFCSDFLDHIYIDRENSVQTRNNYLIFLQSFSSWLVSKDYLKTKPVEGISKIGKGTLAKNRTIINKTDMVRLQEYLLKKNKHFLLAAYFLHYVLIRPREIAQLTLGHINISKQTIFVPDHISKNKKSAVVTLPAKVIKLMLELGIFNNPSSYYIFSDGFMPGEKYRSEKQFRDFWLYYVRKDLKFPVTYKFYSLKDTGITEMLRSGCDNLSVKEQARHSSLLMTDIYTPQNIKDANAILLNYEGVL